MRDHSVMFGTILAVAMFVTAAVGQAPSPPPGEKPPVAKPAPLPAPPANSTLAQSPFAGLPTLLPGPSDAGNIDEVVLPAKPAVVLTGTSTWDDGFLTLFDGFKRIAAELSKAGIKPAGRPLTVFLETDDTDFRFEAMVPIEKAPDDRTALTSDIRFGTTPSGKAFRFTHKAAYEEIDNTYEAITAYLDAKGITVKDAFIEEYVTDPKDASDEDLGINIYVQPR